MPNNLQWAEAFLNQAKIDLDLAQSLRKLLARQDHVKLFPGDATCYYPVIVAHCQQAIEKSLKAMIYAVEGRSGKLRNHNPLDVIWYPARNSKTKKVLQRHNIIRGADEANAANNILRLAPGASTADRAIETLLRQRNTEYPFESANDGRIQLPYNSITEIEVAEALKLTNPLLTSRLIPK